MRADISVRGRPMAAARARELLEQAFPLLAGRGSHAISAAATAKTVCALLGDDPVRVHVPAPRGLPGGYPVLASRTGIELDLPDGCSEADAIAINAVGARWDGIERIAPDGTIAFTPELSDASERLLGLRLGQVSPGELDAVADELEARLQAG